MATASHTVCPIAVERAGPRTTFLAPSIRREGARSFSVVNADSRRWFALAVGSLVVAGLLSLSVVLGRLPVLSGLIGDPLFFKRCLVVHVDLALVVWFYAFLAGLSSLRTARVVGWRGRVAFAAAVGGVVAMLAGALVDGAQPVLANYVPIIDHPLFLGGLAAFFLGTLLFLLESLATRSDSAGLLPEDAAIGLQAAVVGFVLAGATWIATRSALPAGHDTWTRYEFSAWGAGHVLQVANVAAMLSVWLWLLQRATGRTVLRRGTAGLLFTLLVAPHFAMPVLTARGALDPLYHTGATTLMRWTIFPVVLVLLAVGGRHLWRNRGVGARGVLARIARAGFLASAGLTLLGFVLGACIRSSTTLVPAHYHAALGGVTVSFMAAAYLVCAAFRAGSTSGDAGLAGACEGAAAPLRTGVRQLALFGVGQAVFAVGFGIGGMYGLGRKAYAAEQHVRSAGELLGLGVMGAGGLVAAVAGVWFLTLVVRELPRWWRASAFSASQLHE